MGSEHDDTLRIPPEGVRNLSTVSLGAVTVERLLAMAAFMRDYRPAQVFGQQRGGARRSLHSIWVSGLVGEAVARCCCGRAVRLLRIEHLGEACERQSLHGLLVEAGTVELPDSEIIRFVVVNESGNVLARALAELISAVDSDRE